MLYSDYNEDRQITFDDEVKALNHDSLISAVDKSSDDDKAFIYLNTIGINQLRDKTF